MQCGPGTLCSLWMHGADAKPLAQQLPEPWVPASPPTTRFPSACSHLPLILALVHQLARFSPLLFPGCCSLGLMLIGISQAMAI